METDIKNLLEGVEIRTMQKDIKNLRKFGFIEKNETIIESETIETVNKTADNSVMPQIQYKPTQKVEPDRVVIAEEKSIPKNDFGVSYKDSPINQTLNKTDQQSAPPINKVEFDLKREKQQEKSISIEKTEEIAIKTDEKGEKKKKFMEEVDQWIQSSDKSQ